MPFRSREPKDPVRISYDGQVVTADRGEPAAASLLASGSLAIARSTKFHRPRGPSCMRGACDGCLARVNGEPNVMTCMVAAHEGMTIDSQNTLGSKDIDFLRVTDWFFPKGMNHHELLAGIPGAQGVMQAFARRVAGLGRLPQSELASRRATRRQADILVVGCGPSGMAVAIELARAGRSVEIVDDGIRPGGSLRGLFREASGWKSIEEPFQDLVSAERIALFTRTLVGGVFGEDLLVIASSGADVVTARETIFATGAHDGVGLFEGNDLPGVMSARAGCILFADGVVVGKRVAIASRAPGSFGDAFARAAADFCEVITVPSVIGVRGSSAVRAVQVQDGDRQREVRVDALLTDEARSPAYELCLQAGAELVHEPKGFVVRADHGRIREHFWAVGEVRGTALEPQAILDDAKRVASGILA